jgi:hypothetical protein
LKVRADVKYSFTCRRVSLNYSYNLLPTLEQNIGYENIFCKMRFFTSHFYFVFEISTKITRISGESNGNLPLRICPGCSVPEPYRSHDWVLVPAKTGVRAEY